jgi:HAMP domain-containing protein
MPNQQLTADEIDALVGFINRQRTQGAEAP